MRRKAIAGTQVRSLSSLQAEKNAPDLIFLNAEVSFRNLLRMREQKGCLLRMS